MGLNLVYTQSGLNDIVTCTRRKLWEHFKNLNEISHLNETESKVNFQKKVEENVTKQENLPKDTDQQQNFFLIAFKEAV